MLNKKQEKCLTSYPRLFLITFRGEKVIYPNNITPLIHLLGVNGKDAAIKLKLKLVAY